MSGTKLKLQTPGDLCLYVQNRIGILESARKQSMAEFDADLRALREINKRIRSSDFLNEPELFKPEMVLSPETIRLLEAPLAKYSAR